MASYRSVGEIPPKRHTAFRQPDGSLYSEELMGEEGFSSDSSLLYHRGIPSAMSGARNWTLPDLSTTPNHPLRPVHLRLPELFGGDPAEVDHVTGRRLVLGNATFGSPTRSAPRRHRCTGTRPGTSASTSSPAAASSTPCSAPSPFRDRDYVIIPRATVHRWRPYGEVKAYCIEANSHIAPAEALSVASTGSSWSTARTASGISTRRPSRCWATVKTWRSTPSTAGTARSGIVGSVVVASTHPFDVVGWDGCLYPYTFNVDDFEPITGRVHQPPPVHQVFEGGNFVVCNFVPRKVDYHPLAIPVPYYHSNVDSDEVMFYCGGDYEARKGSGIGLGSITLHPGGHSHGPQPGTAEAAIGKHYFDELAVMVDTFRPLEFGEGGVACDDQRLCPQLAPGPPGRPVGIPPRIVEARWICYRSWRTGPPR